MPKPSGFTTFTVRLGKILQNRGAAGRIRFPLSVTNRVSSS